MRVISPAVQMIRSTVSTLSTDDGRHVHVPAVGDLAVPPRDKITYYVGLGALAAIGVLEWPVAGAIVAGHLLADQHRFAVLRGLGKAAEAA